LLVIYTEEVWKKENHTTYPFGHLRISLHLVTAQNSQDAKKDGVPPDARWTKISRKLVNPEALEAGKERYEAREDFVIVLRVLSRDEVQAYAEVTERIRGMIFLFSNFFSIYD